MDTPLVTLSAQGDAEFDGNLLARIPAVCTPSNVAFLVRIAAGRWIANGAVRSSPCIVFLVASKRGAPLATAGLSFFI